MLRAFVGIFWNREQHRLRAIWRLLVGAIILSLIGAILNLALLAVGHWPSAVAFARSAWLLVAYVGGVRLLAALLGLGLIAWLVDRRPWADYGLHLDARWWLDLAFGLVLGACAIAAIFFVERAAGWLVVTGTWQVSTPGQSFLGAWLVPLAVFLCVGIQEEMVYRGFLVRNLAEGARSRRWSAGWATAAAWLGSSLAFGLAHAANPNASLVSTVQLVVAGITLGLGYVLTGRLGISIGLHITWNLFEGNVFGFPVSGLELSQTTVVAISQTGPELWTGGAFGPEAGLIGLIIEIIGCLLTLLWVRWRYGRIALTACSYSGRPGLGGAVDDDNLLPGQ